MNPYTAALLRRVRDLSLSDARDVLNHWKYAERWVFFDRFDRCCGMEASPVRGDMLCLGREFSPAIQVRQQNDLWVVTCSDQIIGTTEALSEAVDMAESELELRGYVIPWRLELRRTE